MQEFPVEKLHALIPNLLLISLDAGSAILEVYGSNFAVEHKDDKSPLTLADKRSHEVIVKGLSRLEGIHVPVLSEEGKSMPFEERRGWEIFWLVDPLDGTKEFIKRNGEFTVNIALIQKGRPVLGVIFIPVKNIFYFGAEGLGSFKLERGDVLSSGSLETILSFAVKLPLGPHSSLTYHASRLTVIASRSHLSPETALFIDDLRGKHGELDFISAGSSLKFCLIAEGIADVYPRFAPTMEWDTAAGQAIVENAGGRVLRADSRQPVTYNKEDLLNPWFVAERYP